MAASKVLAFGAADKNVSAVRLCTAVRDYGNTQPNTRVQDQTRWDQPALRLVQQREISVHDLWLQSHSSMPHVWDCVALWFNGPLAASRKSSVVNSPLAL